MTIFSLNDNYKNTFQKFTTSLFNSLNNVFINIFEGIYYILTYYDEYGEYLKKNIDTPDNIILFSDESSECESIECKNINLNDNADNVDNVDNIDNADNVDNIDNADSVNSVTGPDDTIDVNEDSDASDAVDETDAISDIVKEVASKSFDKNNFIKKYDKIYISDKEIIDRCFKKMKVL